MKISKWADSLSSFDVTKILFFGYLYYVMFGWGLLCLPISQAIHTSSLDNLFTATSAVSTTGLATVSIVEHYNLFGQIIIMFLIQIGGIGYMTLGAFVTIALFQKLPSLFKSVCRKNFSLPNQTQGNISTIRFIKISVIYTLIVEAVGALLLYSIFLYNNEENALWSAIFHSVSAFSTAGFGLKSNSFENYYNNVYFNIVLNGLCYLGAIGFIIVVDIWYMIRTPNGHLHFTTKVILKITFWIIMIGTFGIFLFEPSIQHYDNWERLLIALFQVINASTTAGFNSVPLKDFSIGSLMILYIIMMIGASPAGTGGGLKTTSFAVIFALVRSTIKERNSVRFDKREISFETIQFAITNLVLYLVIAFLGLMILSYNEQVKFEALIFEVISALSTVGLSMGITADLSGFGKFILILLMFIGRLGLVTFGLLVASHDETREEEQDNTLTL